MQGMCIVQSSRTRPEGSRTFTLYSSVQSSQNGKLCIFEVSSDQPYIEGPDEKQGPSSDLTLPEDAATEHRTVATLALTFRRSNHSAQPRSHSAKPHPISARSHPQSAPPFYRLKLSSTFGNISFTHDHADLIHSLLVIIQNRL